MATFNGTREAFCQAILTLREKDERIMFVSSDSLKAMRSTSFAESYPESYIEAGIAEQSAVAAAAGMAASGMIPYVATYAGFLTMRACEQMRTFVAYPHLNVKFVGINAGLIGGEREGVTHQFYEDLGILSAIPGFTIFTPADGNQTYKACLAAAEIDGPVYIRAGSGREQKVYDMDAPFSPDGFTVLREYGDDVLILGSGFILGRVLKAADLLHQGRIQATAADVNILQGKNNSKLIELISSAKRIVTVEDHNINGGLGSYISCLACEYNPIPVKRMGLSAFAESGPAEELADYYGFSAENIERTVQKLLNHDH